MNNSELTKQDAFKRCMNSSCYECPAKVYQTSTWEECRDKLLDYMRKEPTLEHSVDIGTV